MSKPNNSIPGRITPAEMIRLRASVAASRAQGWAAVLPGKNRRRWQQIRAAVRAFGNRRANAAVRVYQIGFLPRFGDLKIVAALYAALDDHEGFEACLRAYDRRLALPGRDWTAEFSGLGLGAGSLDVYRILRSRGAARFEKIYSRQSECYQNMAFFYEHVAPRLKTVRVPVLHEIARGRHLAAARFELVAVAGERRLDIDLAAETIAHLAATDLSGLDIPKQLREFRRSDFRLCEARLHDHLSRNWPDQAETLRARLAEVEAEIRTRPAVLCHGDLNRNNFSGHGHVLDWDASGVFPRGYDAGYVAAIATRREGFGALQRLFAEKFARPDAPPEDFRAFLFFVLYFLQKYPWREKTRPLQHRILYELGCLHEPPGAGKPKKSSKPHKRGREAAQSWGNSVSR